MPVTRLSLTDFRSYPDAVIDPGPGFVVLTGENGAGKTNILEAVSMLAPGRGLRRATLKEMARQGGPGNFAIAARLAGEGEPVDIGTGTTPAAPDRRKVRINGADATATALADWLTVLWLTPAMDRLFTGPPGDRRRFLDRLAMALEPGHGRHAARYEAALRARNRLLADPGPLDEGWCAALEAQLGEHGTALAEARMRTVAALNAALADEPDEPFAKPLLSVEGSGHDGQSGTVLADTRARDRAAGRTLSGPHRADLTVTHAAKAQPAALCSTGEQKAMLLALVLAHADLVARRNGRRPVLLLDEVAAHLDPVRRQALFERLTNAGGQVWMTGTEDALFANLPADAQRFSVAPGRISRT